MDMTLRHRDSKSDTIHSPPPSRDTSPVATKHVHLISDHPSGKIKHKDARLFSLFHSVFTFVASLIGFVHFRLHRVWLKFLRAVTIPWFYPNESFFHHIIIAGDDHAFGIGDWCTPGHKVGIAERLINDLRSQKVLRHTWRAVNMGHPQSSSRDWLPSTPLFRQTFLRGSSQQRHDDVVVLMVGANDAWMDIPGKETANNIRAIAEILANEYAFVFVCTVPNWLVSVDLPNIKALDETNVCNAALRIWIGEQLSTSNIKLGAEIDRTNTEYRLGRLYYHDHKHFSALGYSKVSKDLALEMAKPLRQVEFSEEQKHLQ